MPVSKNFVRIGAEGQTTDGRKIERSWLEDAAANFNTKLYGARIWLEHIRGFVPDSPFDALGDVTELKTEEFDDNGVKKLGLYAKLDVTDNLVAMNKARQKIYTSMEIDTDFADTGGAYLVGLAVTDSPASLNNDMLAFSSKAAINPLESRKQRPENLFSAALEASFEFEPETEKPEQSGVTLLSKVKDLLGLKNKTDEAKFNDIGEAVETIATSQKESIDSSAAQFKTLEDGNKAQAVEFAALKKSHDDLVEKLSKEPAFHTPRGKATGGDGQQQTNC